MNLGFVSPDKNNKSQEELKLKKINAGELSVAQSLKLHSVQVSFVPTRTPHLRNSLHAALPGVRHIRRDSLIPTSLLYLPPLAAPDSVCRANWAVRPGQCENATSRRAAGENRHGAHRADRLQQRRRQCARRGGSPRGLLARRLAQVILPWAAGRGPGHGMVWTTADCTL